MTSQPDYQILAMQILPNISRSKGNQTMKLGQLVEYNMRHTFVVEKSYTKCDEKTISASFSKKSKLRISLDQLSLCLISLLLLYANLRALKI